MGNADKPFEMQKTFGLDVLLKLIKTNVTGLKVIEDDGKLRVNVGFEELSSVVDKTIKAHNINLKIDKA